MCVAMTDRTGTDVILLQEVLSLLFRQLTVKAEEGFYKNGVFML